MERKRFKYTEEVRNNGVSVGEEEVFFDGYDDGVLAITRSLFMYFDYD